MDFTKSEYRRAILEAQIPSNAKFLAFALLEYQNSKTNLCYPSLNTLSDAMGLCRNAVLSALRALEQSGLVQTKKIRFAGSKFTVNSYTFPITSSLNEPSSEPSYEPSNDSSFHSALNGHKPLKPIKPIKPKNTPQPPKGGALVVQSFAVKDGIVGFDELFERFWAIYPKIRANRHKEKAKDELRKLLVDGQDYLTIGKGIAAYRKYCDQTGEKQPDMFRWLKVRGYQDDYTTNNPGGLNGKPTRSQRIKSALDEAVEQLNALDDLEAAEEGAIVPTDRTEPEFIQFRQG
jgi:hypothetical protein